MLNKCTQNPLYHQKDTAVVKEKVTRLQLKTTWQKLWQAREVEDYGVGMLYALGVCSNGWFNAPQNNIKPEKKGETE